MKDEMDILREIGTTVAAHGSIALSEILGTKITLELPTIKILTQEKLHQEMTMEGVVLSLQSRILSGMDGKIAFILEEKNAFKLIDMCYKTGDLARKIGVFTEMGMSVIREVGNIIISSYVNTLSFFMKNIIIPSYPMLINAPASEIINMIIDAQHTKEDYLFVIDTVFEEQKEKIRGNSWIVLTPKAADSIKRMCKEILESLK